jgi:hypothetical protein
MGNTIPTKPQLKKETALQIQTMQENILNKQDEINQQIRAVDETQSTLQEGFTNMQSVRLNPLNYAEISDYANVYNKNVALLDDPNNMSQAAFDTYIYLQNKKISELQTNLSDLQNNIQKNKKKTSDIKGFKSMSNSQILNTEIYNTNNSNSNINNSSMYPNYLIYGNNKCLEYKQSYIDNNNIPQSASWSFQSCNANDPKQQFISNKINDINTYNSYIKDPSNMTSKIKSNNTTLFGFNVVNPANDTSQCLQLNSDGLSVMPCTLDFTQRFKPIYNTVIP